MCWCDLSRNNLVPFNIYTQGIQRCYIRPSTASGNTVTIGDLSGTATRRVEVDINGSTVNAGGQLNSDVRLVVNGTMDTITEGAGPTWTINKAWPSGSDIINMLVQQEQNHPPHSHNHH
jgi:hypothetical protein